MRFAAQTEPRKRAIRSSTKARRGAHQVPHRSRGGALRTSRAGGEADLRAGAPKLHCGGSTGQHGRRAQPNRLAARRSPAPRGSRGLRAEDYHLTPVSKPSYKVPADNLRDRALADRWAELVSCSPTHSWVQGASPRGPVDPETLRQNGSHTRAAAISPRCSSGPESGNIAGALDTCCRPRPATAGASTGALSRSCGGVAVDDSGWGDTRAR
jgi:hypothetical protein